MLKTIKRTKQLRLDELIKYAWENSVNEKRVFLGNHGQRVVFDNVGGFYPSGYAYSPDSTFTVEIEEEITEDTEFSGVQEVYLDIEEQKIRVEIYFGKTTIEEVLNNNDDNTKSLQIHALINGKRELIWKREKK